jgi:hypothetical protein
MNATAASAECAPHGDVASVSATAGTSMAAHCIATRTLRTRQRRRWMRWSAEAPAARPMAAWSR